MSRYPFGYRFVRGYFRLLSDGVLCGKTWYLGRENIPADGTPVLVVSNHQNCLNDAVGIYLGVNDRVVHFLARSEPFELHPWVDRLLRHFGLLPAYRLMVEGEDQVSRNRETFDQAEQILLDGGVVAIYPEAGHQQGHWLGTFSLGYLRLAFEAARRADFRQEIFILPSCNHYSDYRELRFDQMTRFGEAFPLSPFYAQYQAHPRATLQAVDQLVRTRIRQMMLDVQDRAHYEELDLVRRSTFGRLYACLAGKVPSLLPERLESDKMLVASLEQAGAAAEPIYEAARRVKQAEEALGVTESSYDRNPSLAGILLRMTVLLLLSPLALVALWPALPCWQLSMYFFRHRSTQDPMFQSSFVLGITVCVAFPLFALLTLVCVWAFLSLPWALLSVAVLPLLMMFEAVYVRRLLDVRKDFRWIRLRRRGRLQQVDEERMALYVAFRDFLAIVKKSGDFF